MDDSRRFGVALLLFNLCTLSTVAALKFGLWLLHGMLLVTLAVIMTVL